MSICSYTNSVVLSNLTNSLTVLIGCSPNYMSSWVACALGVSFLKNLYDTLRSNMFCLLDLVMVTKQRIDWECRLWIIYKSYQVEVQPKSLINKYYDDIFWSYLIITQIFSVIYHDFTYILLHYSNFFTHERVEIELVWYSW